MTRRKWTFVGLLVAVFALGGPLLAISTDISKPEQKTPPLDLASGSAQKFMNDWVEPNGRAKTDPGQSQVQAQGLALLVTAASGDSAKFKLSLDWADKNVASSDEDQAFVLYKAWALHSAGVRTGNQTYIGQGNAEAQNITAAPAGPVAGIVNNNLFYLGFKQLESSSARLPLESLADNQRQARQIQMNPERADTYSALPVSSASKMYTGDAMVQALNLATSCDGGDKNAAKFIWTKLRDTRDSRFATSLELDGKISGAKQSVLAGVASAASAQAAGQQQQTYDLLNDVDGIQQKSPTAQGSAWDAVGRILLTTDWLGTCS